MIKLFLWKIISEIYFHLFTCLYKRMMNDVDGEGDDCDGDDGDGVDVMTIDLYAVRGGEDDRCCECRSSALQR